MDQPRALKDAADILFHPGREPAVLLIYQDIFPDVLSQRLGKRRHLQRMSQPCPDKITFIQGKYLGLILKSPEGSAPDDPVVVLLKLTPQVGIPYVFMFPGTAPASSGGQ